MTVMLVTGDDALWPQVGADLPPNLVLKQLDSVDELIANSTPGQPAIVLWDARGHADPASVLSRLNMHSSRLAILAIDNATSAGAWTLPLQHRQVVAHVAIPIVSSALAKALDAASEEVNARVALLGESAGASPQGTPPSGKKFPLVPAIIGAVVVVGLAGYFLTRSGSSPKNAAAPAATPTAPAAAAPKSGESQAERVDSLMEKAQQAMSERHFIDPLQGSALALYRDVLIVDPNNGEARQGLQRLAEILIARVQSALDERKFDSALQYLETARSIDSSDRRLAALDEKIASLRAELGPAQIMAAITAQNFDRANQLIDEAARSKMLPPSKLNQLREEVRKHSAEVEQQRLLKLVDSRLQQDKLLGTDSAAAYLDQARQAGASPATLLPQTQELQKRLGAGVHTAIEQRKFADADRMLIDLHNNGAPAATISALQRELTAARGGTASAARSEPNYVELAQSRLAQGKLTDPDNDSALYYLNQARSSDPRNPALAQLSTTVQGQVVDRARSAFDGGDLTKAESLLQSAATLGSNADIDALNDKIRQKKATAGEKPHLQEQSLTRLNKLEISYPYRAMQAGTEGWVELSYTVKTDGTVSELQVINSNPAGTFDSAALKAVGRLKYQPVVQDGKVTAVSTQVRVVFRIPK
jgi:TonB family protein